MAQGSIWGRGWTGMNSRAKGLRVPGWAPDEALHSPSLQGSLHSSPVGCAVHPSSHLQQLQMNTQAWEHFLYSLGALWPVTDTWGSVVRLLRFILHVLCLSSELLLKKGINFLVLKKNPNTKQNNKKPQNLTNFLKVLEGKVIKYVIIPIIEVVVGHCSNWGHNRSDECIAKFLTLFCHISLPVWNNEPLEVVFKYSVSIYFFGFFFHFVTIPVSIIIPPASQLRSSVLGCVRCF